ncbi:MAG: ThiF family adenylyltransferase [Thermoguttaceae bacterium]
MSTTLLPSRPSPRSPLPRAPGPSLSRLPETSLFHAGDAWPRWSQSSLLIAGAGALGTPLAFETVRAGARGVTIVDKDTITDPLRIGAGYGGCGRSKAFALAGACEAITPGRVRALHGDLRHVGVGVFAAADLIVDATDDPNLAGYLTRISNGVGTALMRVAVDGSGRHNRGRVLISHGGGGHACQLCCWEVKHLLRSLPRTPCPGVVGGPAPTLAAHSTTTGMAGVALHYAMRLLTGDQDVLDRETIIDLDNMQIIQQRLARAEACLSGHKRWQWEQVDARAQGCTLRAAFDLLSERLGGEAELSDYCHPLWTAADCSNCGGVQGAVGTWWAVPPACSRCGAPTAWQLGSDLTTLALHEAEQWGVLDRTLAELGLPERGAMLIGRARGARPVRIVLA